jgi:uncharacterized protein YkwD
LAALLLGCSASAPARPVASPVRAPPLVKLELPAGAFQYDSRAAPGAVIGSEAEGLERALLDIAQTRGMQLEGDGRLAALGQFILSVFKTQGRPPTSASIDACAHHLGLIEPVPLFMIFGKAEDGSWATSLQEMLRDLPRNTAYNRYGIAAARNMGQPLAVSVLSAASAEIQPIARRAEPGATVTLRGRLRERFRHAEVEVTRPDGSVAHVGEAPGTEFELAVPLPTAGVHRVEILAHGPYGTEVLANFPIFAGVQEPAVVAEATAADPATELRDPRAVEARLLALLNEARSAAGMPTLDAHEGLSQVAVMHSRDMVESGFFGHDSPTYGDPGTRVHKQGLAFVLIAENVGRGSTAEEVNTMLLDSPGHRANALDPNLTHVGIGVVVDARQGHREIVATEEFGGVARPIDVNTAPSDVLNMINANRTKAGARPLIVDPMLMKAAARGADLFFRDPSRSQQHVVASVNEELVKPVNGSSPIAKRMRATQSFLFPVVSLSRTPKLDRTLDPAARYVGVGVAQGTRPETGPNAIAVVVVLGWPR